MAGRPSFRGRMGVEDGAHGEQDRAESSRGDRDVKNAVAMPITARGSSAPRGYGNTGDKLGARGSIGNTVQAVYNDHPGHEGGKGGHLGEEESNFYNDLGEGHNDGEGDSGSGKGAARSIEGFGSGRSTFKTPSHDYNAIGGAGSNDSEGNSGSGLVNPARGGTGRARAVSGFSTGGEKSGKV